MALKPLRFVRFVGSKTDWDDKRLQVPKTPRDFAGPALALFSSFLQPFSHQLIVSGRFPLCISVKYSIIVSKHEPTKMVHLYCCVRAGVPNLFHAMYPFSIPTDEYVPLKFLLTKYLVMIIHGYI